MTDTMYCGFVITDDGTILLQAPDPNSRWGFYLADWDQDWDGGVGVATGWTAIDDNDPRITDEDHQRLDWLLRESLAVD